MIIKYLEKMHQELFNEKLNLEKEYHTINIRIKENIQFIYTLEKSLDKNYECFTPREVNHENYIKIDSLKEEQLLYEKKREEIRKKLSDCNSHIIELESIRKIAKEKQDFIDEKQLQIEEDEIFRQKILKTQELERQRIARDLHDSIVQSLANMIHKIEICSKLMDIDPIRSKLELHTMSKNVREIISDIRRVIYDLRPMSLDDIGLNETLEREIEKINNLGEFKVHYKIEGSNEKLLPVISLTILRIVQEAFNNIVKHAKAQNVEVIVSYHKNSIELVISDDGIGFNSDMNLDKIESYNMENSSGFGISMMKERVYLLTGKIDIESKQNIGTTIRVKVPINKEEI